MSCSIIMLLTIVSCSSDTQNEFARFIKDYPNESNFECYVIIPIQGCTGCYTSAEKFIIENASRLEHINFYLVGYLSQKAMRIRYGRTIVSLDNVNRIESEGSNEPWFKDLHYPTTLFLNGNIIDSIAISDFNQLSNIK